MNASYLEDFSAASKSLPNSQPTWLNGARRNAFEQFSEKGLPTPRNEHWKYTNLKPITKRHFSPSSPVNEEQLARIKPLINQSQIADTLCQLVFVDGHFSVELSSTPKENAQDISISSLRESLATQPDSLKPYLTQNVGDNGFADFNTAFLSDGVVITLPKNSVTNQPIHLLHVMTATENCKSSHLRHLVIAGENAQATIIESYAGEKEAKDLTNVITHIEAGENAQIKHVKCQQESLKSYHIANITVNQQANSRVETHIITTGAILSRSDVNTNLGQGAECVMNGLYLGKGRQHMDHHTLVNHRFPHGTSKELYKGVLDSHARGVFNGKVIVHPDAQKTDAQQQNKNLLLSANAEIDTKPELEIYADDVKCAHGATVGQLDKQALFYLRSRGIAEEEANHLLIYAFIDEIIGRLPGKSIQKAMRSSLNDQLPAYDPKNHQ